MIKVDIKEYTLEFKIPAGTSRGVYTTKDSFFIILTDDKGNLGIGECGILRGLSCDDRPGYRDKLKEVSDNISHYLNNIDKLADWPSIRFGLETAKRSYESSNAEVLYKSSFVEGNTPIPINGLIWMGKPSFMQAQIEDKLKNNFACVKLKIGAIDFEEEYHILRDIRKRYNSSDLEIRVDANGAFLPKNALSKLDRLAKLDIHSIEQPIAAKQFEEMSKLIKNTPLPIALDEELIGVNKLEDKENLLTFLNPQYFILKPSLIGGICACEEWIALAERMNIPWWATSALESNIGLNAIAQWVFVKKNKMIQGLGTGSLYTNNFDSPLTVEKGALYYMNSKEWDYSNLGI
ncbi:MAG: o-succinylbenzoate synthase [Bacteroidales bacterium]